MCNREIVDQTVDLGGAHAGPDMGGYMIQYGGVQVGAFFDRPDLFFCF